jgi:uroporphyrinogen-III synthase
MRLKKRKPSLATAQKTGKFKFVIFFTSKTVETYFAHYRPRFDHRRFHGIVTQPAGKPDKFLGL